MIKLNREQRASFEAAIGTLAVEALVAKELIEVEPKRTSLEDIVFCLDDIISRPGYEHSRLKVLRGSIARMPDPDKRIAIIEASLEADIAKNIGSMKAGLERALYIVKESK